VLSMRVTANGTFTRSVAWLTPVTTTSERRSASRRSEKFTVCEPADSVTGLSCGEKPTERTRSCTVCPLMRAAGTVIV
jgi:hypothetical protein